MVISDYAPLFSETRLGKHLRSHMSLGACCAWIPCEDNALARTALPPLCPLTCDAPAGPLQFRYSFKPCLSTSSLTLIVAKNAYPEERLLVKAEQAAAGVIYLRLYYLPGMQEILLFVLGWGVHALLVLLQEGSMGEAGAGCF